jgi:hypothetical protein
MCLFPVLSNGDLEAVRCVQHERSTCKCFQQFDKSEVRDRRVRLSQNLRFLIYIEIYAYLSSKHLALLRTRRFPLRRTEWTERWNAVRNCLCQAKPSGSTGRVPNVGWSPNLLGLMVWTLYISKAQQGRQVVHLSGVGKIPHVTWNDRAWDHFFYLIQGILDSCLETHQAELGSVSLQCHTAVACNAVKDALAQLLHRSFHLCFSTHLL